MGDTYRITDPFAPYYLTLQIVDWVDVFTRQVYRDIILDSFAFCRNRKGLLLYGYVVMSNHLHLIGQAQNGNLSEILRDFKKFTSAAILRKMQKIPESRREWMLNRFEYAARKHSRNSTYQLWTHENHAVLLTSPSFTRQKLDYIHQNPVRAGMVEKVEDYLYSSARNYAGLGGLIEIDFV